MRNNKELLEQLDRLGDWIKSCDIKASIVLASVGVFLTIITSLLSFEIFLTIIENLFNTQYIIYKVTLLIIIVMLLFGVYSLFNVLVPRLNKDFNHFDGIQKDSLYYFESINDNTFYDFVSKLEKRSEAEDRKDLLSQIYINSKICAIKHKQYRKGIIFTSLGSFSFSIFLIIELILLK